MKTILVAVHEHVTAKGRNINENTKTSSNILDGSPTLLKTSNPKGLNALIVTHTIDKPKGSTETNIKNGTAHGSLDEWTEERFSAYVKEFSPDSVVAPNLNAEVMFDDDWKRTLKDCNDAIEATLNSREIAVENEPVCVGEYLQYEKNNVQANKMCNEMSGGIQNRSARLNTEEIEKTFLDDLINSDNDQDEGENDTFYTACSTPPQNLEVNTTLKSSAVSLATSDSYDSQATKQPIAACKRDGRLTETCFIIETNNPWNGSTKYLDSHAPTAENHEIYSINHLPNMNEGVLTKPNTPIFQFHPITESNFIELEEQITKHQVFKRHPVERRYRKNKPTPFAANKMADNCTYHMRGKRGSKDSIGCISSVNHMSKCEFNMTRVLHKTPYVSQIPSNGGIIYTCEINTEFGKITQNVRRAYFAP